MKQFVELGVLGISLEGSDGVELEVRVKLEDGLRARACLGPGSQASGVGRGCRARWSASRQGRAHGSSRESTAPSNSLWRMNLCVRTTTRCRGEKPCPEVDGETARGGPRVLEVYCTHGICERLGNNGCRILLRSRIPSCPLKGEQKLFSVAVSSTAAGRGGFRGCREGQRRQPHAHTGDGHHDSSPVWAWG